MATGTYSVRAAAAISRRGESHVRRRAGIAFGSEETMVSTDRDEAGAVHVTEEQLAAILDDSNLRAPDSPEHTEPGLRAKAVALPAPPAAKAAQMEEDEVKDEEDEEDEEKVPEDEPPPVTPTKRPYRRRK